LVPESCFVNWLLVPTRRQETWKPFSAPCVQGGLFP
jgi:hypothetical protein